MSGWLHSVAQENKGNPLIEIPAGTAVVPTWLLDGGLAGTLRSVVNDVNTKIVDRIEKSNDPVDKTISTIALIDVNTMGNSTMVISWWYSFPLPWGWGWNKIRGKGQK